MCVCFRYCGYPSNAVQFTRRVLSALKVTTRTVAGVHWNRSKLTSLVLGCCSIVRVSNMEPLEVFHAMLDLACREDMLLKLTDDWMRVTYVPVLGRDQGGVTCTMGVIVKRMQPMLSIVMCVSLCWRLWLWHTSQPHVTVKNHMYRDEACFWVRLVKSKAWVQVKRKRDNL